MKNLFIIKGDQNTGKSTTTGLLHSELSKLPNAKLQCFWCANGDASMDVNKYDVYNNFVSVFDVGKFYNKFSNKMVRVKQLHFIALQVN